MSRKPGPSQALKSVFSLSLGTFAVQSLSAAGQFVLALWLVPSEFGFWAAAVSAMSVLTGFINFGEVNGYLSGSNKSFRRMRMSAFRINSLLGLLGLGVALLYLLADKPTVALYCLIIALTLPLNGEADVRAAAAVHYQQFSSVVRSQSFGAISKFAISILIAISFQTALALALSTVIYYLIIVILLRKSVRMALSEEINVIATTTPLRERSSWALNSYFMSFPVQAIFLSSQFFLTPTQLGLLYIGFQITLALSGLLAVPLNRVVLSTLGRTQPEERGKFAAKLGTATSVIVTIVSSLLALILTVFVNVLPINWIPAVPIAIAFLISMPMRILTPIIEARQQVEKRWTQATAFNVLEAAGSVLVVFLFSSAENIIYLALAISAWKVFFGMGRTLFVLRNEKFAVLAPAPVASILGALILSGGLIWPMAFNLTFLALSLLALSVIWVSYRKGLFTR